MTEEVLQDYEQLGGDTLPQMIEAEPTQVLTGWPVGLPTGRVTCLGCGAQLEEGRAVTVYGYRVTGRKAWNLCRCFCEDCAPRRVHPLTLGVTELLARAWLGTLAVTRTRTHQLCLTEVELVDFSSPDEGAEP